MLLTSKFLFLALILTQDTLWPAPWKSFQTPGCPIVPQTQHAQQWITIYSLCGEFSKGYFCIISPWEKGIKLHLIYFNLEYLGLSKLIA